LDFIWVKKKSDLKFLIFRKSKRESNFLDISNLNSYIRTTNLIPHGKIPLIIDSYTSLYWLIHKPDI
jgi:hypothetical protein